MGADGHDVPPLPRYGAGELPPPVSNHPAPSPPEAPPPSLLGPTSLAELRAGSNVDGDSGGDPSIAPPWLDPVRLAKIAPWFRQHAFTVTLIWHISLTIGFDVPPLLNALVFTGASASAKDALQRYLDTAARLIDWHLGDVFDPESKAFNSVSAVRSIHKGVRISMQSKFPGTHKLNMYNMATVQTGFMGALTVTPGNVFGLKASPEEISDYVYFWRCVGRQLGISDQYNLCGRGAQNSANIVHEIIDELILPGYSNQPPMYQPMAQAYIDGLNVNFLGLPVLTVPSTVAVFFWALGRPRPYSLSLLDSLRFYGIYRVLFLLIYYLPYFETATSQLLLLIFALRPPPSAASQRWGTARSRGDHGHDEGGPPAAVGCCPVTMASAVELPDGDFSCPAMAGSSTAQVPLMHKPQVIPKHPRHDAKPAEVASASNINTAGGRQALVASALLWGVSSVLIVVWLVLIALGWLLFKVAFLR